MQYVEVIVVLGNHVGLERTLVLMPISNYNRQFALQYLLPFR